MLRFTSLETVPGTACVHASGSLETGERVVVPYLNYYIGNGFVVVPTSGHEADTDMVAMIGDLYPDRTAFGLDVGAILAHGGGGIHCITQQVPAP